MGASRWMMAIAGLAVMCLLQGACTRSLGTPLQSEGCLLHHTQAVTPETAASVLEFLVAEGFCGAEGRHVQLDVKQGKASDGTSDPMVLRIATRAEVHGDESYLAVARAFAAQLSGKVLDGRGVDVALCDEDMRVVTEAEGFRWGVHVALDACGIYVEDGLAVAVAQSFLKMVDEDLGCDTPRAFRLFRESEALQLSFVLEEEALATKGAFQQARLTAGRAATHLFEGEPITVHAADVYYVSRRSAEAVALGPQMRQGNCTVFRGPGMDLTLAKRFLDFVTTAGYCHSESKLYHLSRRDEAWHVGVVLEEDVPPAYLTAFKTALGLAAAMFRGAVFDGAPTHVGFCDALFETCQSIVGPDFGRAFTFKNCSIFHEHDLDTTTLDRLRGWLDSEKFCEGPEQLMRLRRDPKAAGWLFMLAVRGAVVGTPEITTLGERLTAQVSRQVLEGAPVRFVAANAQLLPATAPLEPLPSDR